MGHLLNQANVDGGGESWVERFHNYVDRYLEILRYFEASMNNSAICNGEKNVCDAPKQKSVYFLLLSVVSTRHFPFITTMASAGH